MAKAKKAKMATKADLNKFKKEDEKKDMKMMDKKLKENKKKLKKK